MKCLFPLYVVWYPVGTTRAVDAIVQQNNARPLFDEVKPVTNFDFVPTDLSDHISVTYVNTVYAKIKVIWIPLIFS